MQKLLLVYYYSENRATSRKFFQICFFPRFGVKNGGVLSMRMQVILDSSFVRPGSAPTWGGKRGEFRDWTSVTVSQILSNHSIVAVKMEEKQLKPWGAHGQTKSPDISL